MPKKKKGIKIYEQISKKEDLEEKNENESSDEGEDENQEEQEESGAEEESEHTSDPKKAKKIADEHLEEDPNYYRKLKRAGLMKAPLKAYKPKKGEYNYPVVDKEETE